MSLQRWRKKIVTRLKYLKNKKWYDDKKDQTDRLEIIPTPSTYQYIGQNWLIQHQKNLHSEHGEDGIINKIFELLPPTNKWVCEFGAHDPEERSNSWHLIRQGWHAVLIEAADDYFTKLKKYYAQNPQVYCLQKMVGFNGENTLDKILASTPAPSELDFLIIDIDGNDYHVWESIQSYCAKVVMVEFNASIPLAVDFVQAPDQKTNQGASLSALKRLAEEKGYKLIAATAWNAFFVQAQYFHLFFASDIALKNLYVFPAKHPIEMKCFQLYDGSLVITRWEEMLWHKINLMAEDYQVLPRSYRVFNYDLAVADYFLTDKGCKISNRDEDEKQLQKIYAMPGNQLGKYASNRYSRYGEDGILEVLIDCVAEPRLTCVEVGSSHKNPYSLAKNLIITHGAHTFLCCDIETTSAQLSAIYQQQKNVHVLPATLPDKINQVLKYNLLPRDLTVFIIQCLGVEYFVWQKLASFKPKIVVAQFNPTIPNDVKYIQANNINLRRGCSLLALKELAAYKGYELAAVSFDKAFFVDRVYAYRIFEKHHLSFASLDEMFSCYAMHLFQLYDGSLKLDGLKRLLWHAMNIDESKLQVVPKALQVFHQFAEPDYKQHYFRV